MTDFPPQNNELYYQTLDGPTSNQSPNFPSQNTPDQYQPPIQVNQPYNSSRTNIHYRTPINFILVLMFFSFFFTGIGVTIQMFSEMSSDDNQYIYFNFFPLIFTLVAIILGSILSLYYVIDIETSFNTIIIKKVKICCCFNKKTIIQINELQQVIVQTDYSTSYSIFGATYNGFEIIFKLVDGREIKGFSGVIDRNDEGRKAFNLIKNALPHNISFGGNLAY